MLDAQYPTRNENRASRNECFFLDISEENYTINNGFASREIINPSGRPRQEQALLIPTRMLIRDNCHPERSEGSGQHFIFTSIARCFAPLNMTIETMRF